jgi:hypothetical protein
VTRIAILTLLLLAACSGADTGAAGGQPGSASSPADTLAPPADTTAPAPPAAVPDTAPAADTVPADPAAWRVTERGIGPLRAGMTRAEAERLLGSGLRLPVDGGDGCVMAQIPGAPEGTAVLVVNDTLVRADVFRASTTATAAGARIGDTADRIRSLYPGRVRAEPHKYTTGQYLVVLTPPDTTYRLVFETDETGRVTRYRGGRMPEVGWVEVCG